MATYYVRPTNGSDAAAGTSFATAFLTFQKALDSVFAGDEIRLCKEGLAPHETTSVQIDIDGNEGTSSSPIQVYAASSVDGARDVNNGRYVIQASASMARMMYAGSGLGDYFHWHDIEFDGNNNVTTNLWSCANSGGNAHNKFVRIYWHDGDMVNLRGSNHFLIDCVVEDSTDPTAALKFDGGSNHASGCSFLNNTGDGLFADASGNSVVDCLFIGNGADGVRISASNRCHIAHNAFYDNGASGVKFDTALGGFNAVVRNNTFAKNGAYGIELGAATVGAVPGTNMMDYNHYWSNVSGAAFDGTSGVTEGNINTDIFGDQNVTGDPGFTSETAGSEDLKPTADTSVLYQAGISHQGVSASAVVENIIGNQLPDAGGGAGGGGAEIIGSPIIRSAE